MSRHRKTLNNIKGEAMFVLLSTTDKGENKEYHLEGTFETIESARLFINDEIGTTELSASYLICSPVAEIDVVLEFKPINKE